jgi:hypothetical protein
LVLPKGLTLTLGADYEQRGIDQEVEEKHCQGTLKAEWELNTNLTLDVRYGFEKIDNFQFDDGKDITSHMAMLGLHGSW